MSKGFVLVDIPENCINCEYFGLMCKITGEKCNRYNKDGKPDWCPIRPLPKKEKINPYDFCNNVTCTAKERGWNACIDKILKGV